MSLSDADLDLMRRWASMSDPGRNGTMDWEAAIAELQEHRARVEAEPLGTDGPDQGDPAAWGVKWDGQVRGVRLTKATAEEYAEAVSGAVVVPLRAPGAVAAAPPNDEDAVPVDRQVVRVARAACLDVGAIGAAASLREALLAPPAGHEDEAAVERAIRNLHYPHRLNVEGEGDEVCHECAWAWPCDTVTALTAARGPRTPGSDR